MSFRSIVPQINENLKREEWKHLVYAWVLFSFRLFAFSTPHSCCCCFPSHLVFIQHITTRRWFKSSDFFLPHFICITLKHTYTRIRPCKLASTRLLSLNYERKQFVMTWTIISLHVISFSIWKFMTHFPDFNCWLALFVSTLLLSVGIVFIGLVSNRLEPRVNTCQRQTNKYGYSK